MIQKSFTKACMDHFGKKAGQTTLEFAKELKSLTPVDKGYFIDEFYKIGVEIVAPQRT